MHRKNNKPKSWFSEKNNKIAKPLARRINKESKTHITNTRNTRGYFATDYTALNCNKAKLKTLGMQMPQFR